MIDIEEEGRGKKVQNFRDNTRMQRSGEFLNGESFAGIKVNIKGAMVNF